MRIRVELEKKKRIGKGRAGTCTGYGRKKRKKGSRGSEEDKRGRLEFLKKTERCRMQ